MPDAPTPPLMAASLTLDDEPVSPNGHTPEGAFEAKLIADLDGAIREVRDRLIGIEAERDKLGEQIATERAKLNRYDGIRRRLLGESKPGPKPRPDRAPGVPRGTVVGVERLERLRDDIRRIAETRDEFRQVDVRTMPGASMVNSGATAAAFETLRQEGFIRLARVKGNQKFYRLTRAEVGKA